MDIDVDGLAPLDAAWAILAAHRAGLAWIAPTEAVRRRAKRDIMAATSRAQADAAAEVAISDLGNYEQ